MRLTNKWQSIAVACLAAAFLAACATTYDPIIIGAKDQAAVNEDHAECLKIAQSIKKAPDAATVAGDTIGGAADAVDLTAVAPWSIGAGAGKGLLTSVLKWLGVIKDDRASVYKSCMAFLSNKHGYGFLGVQ
jgi:hypothetical protein